MNYLLYVFLGLAAVLLIVILTITARYRWQGQLVPNYRAMFFTGLLLIPAALSTNLGLLAVGIVFSAAGWHNRDLWGKHTKWADYPPVLKKLKLVFAGGMGALVISVGVFLIVTRGQYGGWCRRIRFKRSPTSTRRWRGYV